MYRKVFFRKIITALKLNFIPGVCLWIFALLLGLSYFYAEPVQPVFSYFSELKSRLGVVYSFFSTALFGGLIPFLYLALAGRIKEDLWKVFLFSVFFWAYKGVEVDCLYQIQAYIFGTGMDPATVIKKTFVDQFIYGPLWAAPSMAVAMLWMECGFSLKKMKPLLDRTFFTLQLPSVMIVNMMTWIPALLVIYTLPLPLQLPVSNLTLCFFVLLLHVVAKR